MYFNACLHCQIFLRFPVGFLFMINANEWINKEGNNFITNQFTRSHPSEEKIALEIAAKGTSVNRFIILYFRGGHACLLCQHFTEVFPC